jgi:Calmodulin binding protein-like
MMQLFVAYEKHYPPMANDEVWRLETIAKDGTYQQRLNNNGIKIVQDFLNMWNTDRRKLKEVRFLHACSSLQHFMHKLMNIN